MIDPPRNDDSQTIALRVTMIGDELSPIAGLAQINSGFGACPVIGYGGEAVCINGNDYVDLAQNSERVFYLATIGRQL
jgi:hypothetical protein